MRVHMTLSGYGDQQEYIVSCGLSTAQVGTSTDSLVINDLQNCGTIISPEPINMNTLIACVGIRFLTSNGVDF